MTKEILRKSFHLLIIFIPLAFYHFGKLHSLMFFAPITGAIVGIDYFRRKNPLIQNIFVKVFAPLLRPHELVGDKLCGISFVGIATCLCFTLFKSSFAITAFMILAIADTAASLIGKAFLSQPFFEKSVAGSSAFMVSGFIVLLSCGTFFHTSIWFYITGIFSLVCTTLIEARPSLFNVDDNFTIPVSFAAIMTFFDLVWGYSY